MRDFTFHIPTKIVFGTGKLQALDSLINADQQNILIVTDPVLFTKTEIIKNVTSILKSRNVFVFNEVEENPSYTTVEKGAEIARSKNIELIIGVGGGSSMDAAKGIALRTMNKATIKEIVERNAAVKEVLPILCIPTSSGTGSEATPFAVFTDTNKRTKNGFSHPKIFPFVSLIDPELTYSMPPSVVINTGLDALSHAIEAFLSTESFELNDQLALEAIKIIIENLEKATKKKPEPMNHMAYAAMLGGMVISHASTILPHIMGYPLTIYHGLPHGRACIILQPAFIDYLKKYKLETEKTDILHKLFKTKGGVEVFIQSFGVSTKLSDYGVKESELPSFAKQTIVKDDVKITPGNVTEDIILDIYRNAMN